MRDMILVVWIGIIKGEERKNKEKENFFYSQVTSRNWSDLQSGKYLNAELHKERIMRRISEVIAKNLSSKPVSEATWKNLVNTSSVITGPGADVIANRIPVDEREYITTGISILGTASFGGNPTVGGGHYVSIDWKKGIVEEYDTLEEGINFSNPDIGASVGIAIFPFVNSSEEIKGRSKIIGGEVDLGYIVFKKSLGVSVGTELIYSDKGKWLGFKVYLSKSIYPLGVHGGFVYGTKIENLRRGKLNDYNYWKNNRPRGGKNSWK